MATQTQLGTQERLSNAKQSMLSPNISYEGREIRILTGSAMIITFMLAAPAPVEFWGVTALVAIALIGSGIIAWDPLHALLGVNHYNATEGEIQQRSWSCPNVGTVDRIARLGIGILLLGTAFVSAEIVWQGIAALLAIPVIMTAIIAWDPLYALAYTNTFASKLDVQSADPELKETTLVKFYRFPSVTDMDHAGSMGRAA
jgi:hypothetical protein